MRHSIYCASYPSETIQFPAEAGGFLTDWEPCEYTLWWVSAYRTFQKDSQDDTI